MVSPFHRSQLARGARAAVFGEWQLPADFGDPVAEYRAVRESAGLLDRSARALIRVSGSDRFSWLQGMVSNDVRPLEAGERSIQACVLTTTGHVLSDLSIVRSGSDLLLDLPWSTGPRILALLDQYLIVEDVELQMATGEYLRLSVQGPASQERIGTVSLPDNSVQSPADHTGEGGFDLYVPHSPGAETFWDDLANSGIAPVGETTVETLRIEAGIPLFGIDIDESTIALEAGLGPTHISHTKGCYIGQEIIHRIYSRGHTNRSLTGFRIDSGTLPHRGEKLLTLDDPEREVGWITSAIHSPAVGRPIALGYLRHELRGAGTMLRGSAGAALTVAPLPFSRDRTPPAS